MAGVLISIIQFGVAANPVSMLSYWLWMPLLPVVVISTVLPLSLSRLTHSAVLVGIPSLVVHLVPTVGYYLQPATLTSMVEWKNRGVYIAPPTRIRDTAIGNGFWAERVIYDGMPYIPWRQSVLSAVDLARLALLMMVMMLALLMILSASRQSKNGRRTSGRVISSLRDYSLPIASSILLLIASWPGYLLMTQLGKISDVFLIFREPWTKFALFYYALVSLLIAKALSNFDGQCRQDHRAKIYKKRFSGGATIAVAACSTLSIASHNDSVQKWNTQNNRAEWTSIAARLWTGSELEQIESQIRTIESFRSQFHDAVICVQMLNSLPSSYKFIQISELLFHKPVYADWVQPHGTSPKYTLEACPESGPLVINVQWNPAYQSSDDTESAFKHYLESGASVTGDLQDLLDDIMSRYRQQTIPANMAVQSMDQVTASGAVDWSRTETNFCIDTRSLRSVIIENLQEISVCIRSP